MYIKKYFKILLLLMIFSLLAGCKDKERLNPKDPLSPYYEQPYRTITIVSNIIINHTNTTIIDEDTTWNNSYGPIKVIQNILITGDATLTIEPGTEIQFFAVGPSGTTGIVGIIVDNGAIYAEGVITDIIKFDAIVGAQTYIVFLKDSMDSKCILKYCDLRGTFVYCIAAKPTIQYNKIMDLSLFDNSDLILQFNDIETLLCTDSSVVIKSNRFYLTEYNNNILITGDDSFCTIINNNIEGGTDYRIKNESPRTQYAINNYWGPSLTNSSLIEGKIWDYTDDPDKIDGPVLFIPFYTNAIDWIGSGWSE